jgi:SAM-dependent methyltransferase
MTPPDWRLPPGVDRGLWDYLHAADMVRGYDEQMAASPLARADVAFCERAFPTPGRLLDLGCGTGRLCVHFAAKGYDCVGVDLSDEMLARARENAAAAGTRVEWLRANLVGLDELPAAGFDYAACLFSTLGMVRGAENQDKVLANVFRLLKPGGQFVLHVHNRHYRGLGWIRVAGQAVRTFFNTAGAGDLTMPQAYGGAPLTLHHFTLWEVVVMLVLAGFPKPVVMPLGIDGEPANRPNTFNAYGWLLQCERPG